MGRNPQQMSMGGKFAGWFLFTVCCILVLMCGMGGLLIIGIMLLALFIIGSFTKKGGKANGS